MKKLSLNDKIVIALLLHGHCQGGFCVDSSEIQLKDGYKVSDFEHYSEIDNEFSLTVGITEEADCNISYQVKIESLMASINFFGKNINVHAKTELDLANKIAHAIELQCKLADIAFPMAKSLTYVFMSQSVVA